MDTRETADSLCREVMNWKDSQEKNGGGKEEGRRLLFFFFFSNMLTFLRSSLLCLFSRRNEEEEERNLCQSFLQISRSERAIKHTFADQCSKSKPSA